MLHKIIAAIKNTDTKLTELKKALEENPDLALEDQGKTAIEFAAQTKKMNCVRAIAKSQRADEKDTYRYGFALHEAVRVRDTDTATVLLEQSASTSWHERDSRNGLLHFAAEDDAPMVKLLLKYGLDPQEENAAKQTPLEYACDKKSFAAAEEFLSLTSYQAKDRPAAFKALLDAIQFNRNNIVRFLLNADVSITQKTETEQHSALHWAAKHNNPEAIALLLAKNASISATNKDKETPLQLASRLQFAECVNLLQSRALLEAHQAGDHDAFATLAREFFAPAPAAVVVASPSKLRDPTDRTASSSFSIMALAKSVRDFVRPPAPVAPPPPPTFAQLQDAVDRHFEALTDNIHADVPDLTAHLLNFKTVYVPFLQNLELQLEKYRAALQNKLSETSSQLFKPSLLAEIRNTNLAIAAINSIINSRGQPVLPQHQQILETLKQQGSHVGEQVLLYLERKKAVDLCALRMKESLGRLLKEIIRRKREKLWLITDVTKIELGEDRLPKFKWVEGMPTTIGDILLELKKLRPYSTSDDIFAIFLPIATKLFAIDDREFRHANTTKFYEDAVHSLSLMNFVKLTRPKKSVAVDEVQELSAELDSDEALPLVSLAPPPSSPSLSSTGGALVRLTTEEQRRASASAMEELDADEHQDVPPAVPSAVPVAKKEEEKKETLESSLASGPK